MKRKCGGCGCKNGNCRRKGRVTPMAIQLIRDGKRIYDDLALVIASIIAFVQSPSSGDICDMLLQEAEQSLWPVALRLATDMYTGIFYFYENLFRIFVPRQERPIGNQVVLVTGSATPLGREISLRLAQRGARLVLWDSDPKGQEKTTQLLAKSVKGSRVDSQTVDLQDLENVRSAAQKVKNDVGNVDLLIHATGSEMTSGRNFVDLEREDLERDFNGSAVTLFNVLKSILPQMMETKKGQVVSLVGVGGHIGLPKLSSYCTSKYAIVGLLDTLRIELKNNGLDDITITELSPWHCVMNTDEESEIASGCLGPIAEEAVQRILRNEERIMIPWTWASSIMALKFFLPFRSAFAFVRASNGVEFLTKVAMKEGKERLEKAIEKSKDKPASQPNGTTNAQSTQTNPSTLPPPESPAPIREDPKVAIESEI